MAIRPVTSSACLALAALAASAATPPISLATTSAQHPGIDGLLPAEPVVRSSGSLLTSLTLEASGLKFGAAAEPFINPVHLWARSTRVPSAFAFGSFDAASSPNPPLLMSFTPSLASLSERSTAELAGPFSASSVDSAASRTARTLSAGLDLDRLAGRTSDRVAFFIPSTGSAAVLAAAAGLASPRRRRSI